MNYKWNRYKITESDADYLLVLMQSALDDGKTKRTALAKAITFFLDCRIARGQIQRTQQP